jgi:N-acetylneuraminate lyase
MSKSIPGGVWPAMFSPLNEDRTPNLDAIDRLVDLLAGQQLGGLYILGSTGQGPALRLEDRRAIAVRTIKAARGRIAVMVHVGCIATEDAVELAKHAADNGADAISSVPPIYFTGGADVTFEHYNRIAAATSLPFYCYHASFLQSAVADPAEYTRRLLAIPNIAGVKYTDRDLYVLSLIHRHSKGALQLFSGADELVCHAVLSGADGAIGTFYNLWGPAVRKARASFAAGDVAGCQRFMSAFQGAIERILSSGAVYHFCRQSLQIKYGIDIGPGRTPSSVAGKPWAEGSVREVIAMVDAAA